MPFPSATSQPRFRLGESSLSYPSFERATEVVNQFINLLAEHGVDLRQRQRGRGRRFSYDRCP